jgi:hypothetical protein
MDLRNTVLFMLRSLCRASLALTILCSVVANTRSQAAVLLTFGGYQWGQANVPNQGIQLGVVDATARSGASFGPAQPSANMTRTSGNITGFIEGQAGVNTGVGYLSRITKRRNGDPTPNAPLESSGTKAVNIPKDRTIGSGDIGTSIIRRGIQVGWSAGTNGFAHPVMTNVAGNDFVIWESGDHAQPDAMMTRVRNAVTQQFTPWFYFTPSEHAVSGSVLFAFEYDLTNFGFGSGAQIDLIEMANMVSTDRIAALGTNTANGWVAQGKVWPEHGGAFSATNPGPNPGSISPAYGTPFGSSTYDPDPLYVSVAGNLQQLAVPEPASFIVWPLVGLLGAIAFQKITARSEAPHTSL